jgi:hypothetical protein
LDRRVWSERHRPFAAIGVAGGHHAELDVGDIAQLADRVPRNPPR